MKHQFFDFGRLTSLIIATAAILFVVLIIACEQKDVLPLVDADQINLYLENEEKAQDLFRWESLVAQTEYQMPGNPAVFYDSVTGHTRSVDVLVEDSFHDYGNLGYLWEAVAVVVDELQVKTFKIADNDTTSADATRIFSRAGFFLKLDDDRAYYAGWELWGFGNYGSATPPVIVSVAPSGGVSFPGDYAQFTEHLKGLSGAFIKLSDIKRFSAGQELGVTAETRNVSSPSRYVVQSTILSGSGYTTSTMTRIDENHYSDTLTIAGSSPHIYDFITLQAFSANAPYEFSQGWVIPYRLTQ